MKWIRGQHPVAPRSWASIGRGLRWWCSLALLATSASATEFGGMVLGPRSTAWSAAEFGAGVGGLAWIRNPQGTVPAGVRVVRDARLLLPPEHHTAPLLPSPALVFHACRDGVATGPRADAWEVWNEPDFHFVESSAADMAAVLKAAWWGVKSADPRAAVVMPSLAFRPGRYAMELAHNGLASWTDAYNAHFYGWADDYAPVLAHHERFRRAADVEAPVWITEIGFHLARSAADDPEALQRQSAFHQRVLLESHLHGVAVHLVFALTPFEDGGWDFGLTEADGRPRPALKDGLVLARELKTAVPARQLRDRRTGATMGAALEQDGRWWVVLWSSARPRETMLPGVSSPERPERQLVGLRWGASPRSIQLGLDGQSAVESSQLTHLDLVPETVHHLRFEGALPDVEGAAWVSVTSPLPRGRRPRVSSAWRAELADLPARGTRSPVILWLETAAGLEADKPSQTLRPTTDAAGELRLHCLNLGDRSRTGRWTLEVPDGWSVTTSGATNSPLTLAAGGSAQVSLAVRRATARPGSSVPGRLTARWIGEDGAEDRASVRLEAPPSASGVLRPLRWRDLQARPSHPAGWQVFEIEPGRLHVEILEPLGPQQDAVIRWPVPRDLRAEDLLEVDLGIVSARGVLHGQLFLVTDEGGVWRHDEWRRLDPAAPLALRARLGDFAPAIWSRPRDFGGPDVRRARWMILRLQGASGGDVVELRHPAWRKVGAEPRSVAHSRT